MWTFGNQSPCLKQTVWTLWLGLTKYELFWGWKGIQPSVLHRARTYEVRGSCSKDTMFGVRYQIYSNFSGILAGSKSLSINWLRKPTVTRFQFDRKILSTWFGMFGAQMYFGFVCGWEDNARGWLIALVWTKHESVDDWWTGLTIYAWIRGFDGFCVFLVGFVSLQLHHQSQ